MYGSTESGVSIIGDFSAKALSHEGSIGRPAFNSRITIVDENGAEIAAPSPSSPGFIACNSPANMVGYWNDKLQRPDKHEGPVRSDDLAYIDEDGEVILIGRSGDVINVGGFKVLPQEVEEAARTLPWIADCACVPVPDEQRGQGIKLLVVLKGGAGLSPELQVELRHYLMGKLEPYKVPASIIQIDSIPRTSKGSVRREILRQKFVAR